jgi:hypothetical protein
MITMWIGIREGQNYGEIKYYTYSGQIITDEACSTVDELQNKLGDDAIINGISSYDVCGKNIIKVNINSTKNINLTDSWIAKTAIKEWNIPMQIFLTLMSCILFVALVAFVIGTV